jgi:poly(ribitol-phosphate) beta-N-acetylglucosaminyltransferase
MRAATTRRTPGSPRVPDVTVIVAVYNTMPYLTRCLKSLVRQSIGLSRLEIIAVDDGSTDGSAAELDRFVRRFPDAFTVVHQANSGGPAMPSNRALRLATGRYVFFVGADDYLGRQALERLVAAGDRHGSDVVAGRMVGCNGRFVPKAIFARTDPDVDLYASALPFALSNTKLFRRRLLDDHQIRFREDLPFGSDQPFTLTACVHAARISVLADYDYYFAVRRHDATNITYRSGHQQRLACTAQIMADTATLLPPGSQRDAILHRSFASELCKLTRPDFLQLDRAVQQRVANGIGHLADRYLTEPIAARLDVSRRVRLRLAQHRSLDQLIGAIRQNASHDPLPLTVDHIPDGDRLYAGYPGFRDPTHSHPDAWYLITDSPNETIAHRLTLTGLAWKRHHHGTALAITAHSPDRPSTVTAAAPRLTVGSTRVAMTAAAAPSGGTIVQARLPVRALRSHRPLWADSWDVHVEVGPDGGASSVPLRMPRTVSGRERLTLAGPRAYVVRPVRRTDGELAIDVVPVTMRRLARRIRERLRPERLWPEDRRSGAEAAIGTAPADTAGPTAAPASTAPANTVAADGGPVATSARTTRRTPAATGSPR